MKFTIFSFVLLICTSSVIAQIEYLGVFGGSDIQFVDEVDCITVDGDLIYLQDDGFENVIVFDKNTRNKVTTFGDAQLSQAQDGIAIAGDYIFVVDAAGNELEVFNKSDYTHVTTIDIAEIEDPTGIAEGNGLIFLGDEDDDDIDVFSALPPFNYISSITNPNFNEVTSLAFSNGKLYVVDDISDNVFILNGFAPFAEIGSFTVPLDGDAGVAVASGLIYLITSDNSIDVFKDEPGYPFVEEFNDDGFIEDPKCIFVDITTIYIADDEGDEIHVFSAAALIPTMGQWALFILGLLLTSAAIVFIYKNKAITA